MTRSPTNQTPSQPPLNEIYRDAQIITNIFYWFIALITLGQFAGIFIVLSTNDVFAATSLGLGLFFTLACLILVRRQKIELAAIILVIILISLITVNATRGLGIHHLSIFGYPVILIIASLVARKKWMIFLIVLTILCAAWLVFGELNDLYTPARLERSVPGDFFSVSIILIITAIMLRQLTEALFQSNQKLKDELRERKLAEAKYRSIIENAVDGFFQSTPDGRFLTVNNAVAHMYGYDSPQEMIQKVTDISAQIYVNPELRASFRKRLTNGEKITGFEVQGYRKDGSTFWVSMSAQAIHNASGNILYYEGSIEDITERKLAEIALQQNQQRLEAFFNQSLDGFFFSMFDTPQQWVDATDRESTLKHIFTHQHFTEVNNAMLEQYGIPREKFLKLTSSDVFAHDPQQGLQLRRQLFDNGHVHTETYERRGDGTPAWFEGDYVCMYDNQKRITGFFGIQRDITKRKEDELERERLIHELAVKNAESETLRESLATLVGTFEFSEIIQYILDQIKRVIPYDSASVWKWENNIEKFISGRNLPPEFVEAKIEFIPNDSSSALPILKGQVPYILNNNVQAEFADFNEAPHTFVNSWLAIPLKTHGRVIGLIALDGRQKNQFTEHHAELAVVFANQVAIALENSRLFNELQSELLTREKLIKELKSKNTELEQFTYTVSHDLKAPIITIKGFLGFLEKDVLDGKQEHVHKDVMRINEGVDKMYRLLSELLELSRIGRMMDTPTTIPFQELVQAALDNVHGHLAPRGIAVLIQPNLPAVYGDRQRLTEILQNLLDNAAKYMGNQADPYIEIGRNGEEDGKPIFFVKDNGIGIAPEYHERIFGLFNKLDPKSEGTGIGLALVKRIIEVHGGRIWVESEAGQGSTFYFTL